MPVWRITALSLAARDRPEPIAEGRKEGSKQASKEARKKEGRRGDERRERKEDALICNQEAHRQIPLPSIISSLIASAPSDPSSLGEGGPT